MKRAADLFANLAVARVALDLDGGESQEVRVMCDFEPQRVLVDPDAKVLQRGRKFAIHRF